MEGQFLIVGVRRPGVHRCSAGRAACSVIRRVQDLPSPTTGFHAQNAFLLTEGQYKGMHSNVWVGCLLSAECITVWYGLNIDILVY